MNPYVKIIFVGVGCLAACGHQHTHPEPAGQDTLPANAVRFTAQMQRSADFATQQVTWQPAGQSIHAMARVLPAPGDERVVTARASGIVSLAGQLTPGQGLAQGQPIATIASERLADGNLDLRRQQAQAALTAARQEYERKLPLAADRMVTQAELTQARLAYDNARAEAEALEGDFTATSPVDGHLRQLMVRHGEHVAAGQPIAVVGQNRHLVIEADVQPKHYPLLGSVSRATFRTVDGQRTYTLAELGGHVASYGRAVESGTHQVTVTFAVSQTADLLPGTFLDAHIVAGEEREALTVAREALVEEMGMHFVYVQLGPEVFEKRQVTTGSTDGVSVEITRGLSAGERVVSRGATLVKLTQAAGAVNAASGHVH